MNILLIDDNQEMLDVLTRNIKALRKCTIYCAKNAVDAVAQCEAVNVNLALCDINIPHIDGYGIIDFLYRLFPAIPVIIVSATEVSKLDILGRPSVVSALQKPFEMKDLFSRIDEVLWQNTSICFPAKELSLQQNRKKLDSVLIKKALEKAGGDKIAAAHLLEISHSWLLRLLKLYNIV